MYVVAIPKESEKDNHYKIFYDWIASFETAEAAETFAIKIQDSIIVYDVESLPEN